MTKSGFFRSLVVSRTKKSALKINDVKTKSTSSDDELLQMGFFVGFAPDVSKKEN